MRQRGRGRRGSAVRRGNGGFTLIELSVALMVATLAAGAIATTLTSSVSLSRSNRERATAHDAAALVLQQIRSETFSEVFARYNATAADDPAAGVSPGAAFDVLGLRPTTNDADGRVGQVLFPGDGLELRENLADRWLGTPRDLDGDGAATAGDHAAGYRILPVRVRVSWQGPGGTHNVDLVTVLTGD